MAIPEISPYLPTYATKPSFGNPIAPQPTVPFLQKRSVDYVKGEEGAMAFALAPNSSALALDQDNNVLWVIATDQNGNKSIVKGYNIGEEYNPPKPVTLEDIMSQMKRMDERLSKMEEDSNNGKLNSKSPVQSKPTGSSAGNGQSPTVGKPTGNFNANGSSNAAGS